MTESQPPPGGWPTCKKVDDCPGLQLDAEDHGCVHHTTDAQANARWWTNIREGGRLDARGLTLTSDQLQQLLNAVPRNEQDNPQLTRANFEKTTFKGDASFERARFEGGASFERARFEARALFVGARFEGAAGFGGATFEDDAWFVGAAFSQAASFEGATFESAAGFGRATFEGDAGFVEATFKGVAVLGPTVVGNCIRLAKATFASRLDLEVATPLLDCTRIQLAGGGHLRVGWASVDLTEAEIPQPCILEDGSNRLRQYQDFWDHLRSQPLPAKPSWPVQLHSLRRATVTGLALAAVDLRDCRFHGAHDLERLRVPHTAQLHQAPTRRVAAVMQRVMRRRQRRRILAEEVAWRQAQRWPWARDDLRLPWSRLPGRVRVTLPQDRYRNWQQFQIPEPTPTNPNADEVVEGLEATDVAELYRALRRGREARGDQPGAADFYYGEMEMRRKSSSSSLAERAILFLYWLLSGYALRASRAFIALVAVFAVSMYLLTTGLIDDLTASKAFWVSLESVVLRIPTDSDELTDRAQNLTTVLRIAGPVLLALAVLSIRGRVKR